ncbi:MAG TPA: IS5 family transposase [Rhodobacteraceae bacterium]|nr:IS5 family transposase [Paracoccaceae bacterium]
MIGRGDGGPKSKLHAVTDAARRPIRMFLTGGQRSDYIDALALGDDLPNAKVFLADRGHDADRFRNAPKDQGIMPCIPSRKMRKVPIPHNAELYKCRHGIENSFARLKDWRRVAPRHDRCPKVFLSACALAAVVVFWLRDVVTGPAARTARHGVQDQGQAVAVPVLDPQRGRRDETVCRTGRVIGQDRDLRGQ